MSGGESITKMCASLKTLHCIQTLNKVFCFVFSSLGANFSKEPTRSYGWGRKFNGFQTRAWAISDRAGVTPTFTLDLPALYLLVSHPRYDGEEKGKLKRQTNRNCEPEAKRIKSAQDIGGETQERKGRPRTTRGAFPRRRSVRDKT